jgi:hypothetical protein
MATRKLTLEQKAAAATELAKLYDKVIGRAAGRRRFAEDARRAAKAAGVNTRLIPRDLWNTLSGMDAAELELVAGMFKRLEDAGLVIEIDSVKTCVFL